MGRLPFGPETWGPLLDGPSPEPHTSRTVVTTANGAMAALGAGAAGPPQGLHPHHLGNCVSTRVVSVFCLFLRCGDSYPSHLSVGPEDWELAGLATAGAAHIQDSRYEREQSDGYVGSWSRRVIAGSTSTSVQVIACRPPFSATFVGTPGVATLSLPSGLED